MNHKFERKKNSIFHPAVISLMVISIILNILLSMVVRATQLPFYIDTVGTIIATAMGGIVPGIITAFVTNAVNFFMDGESIFYAPLNMLIAIFSASYFGQHSKLRKHKYHEIYYVLILALIGGGIGAEITWYLYRSPSDYPVIVSFSDFLSSHLGISVWGCHMISTYITDVIDKAISVAISMMIIKFTPSKVKELVRLSSWRQKPMSPQEIASASKRLKGRISVGTRINLIIILSTLLMTLVALAFSIISFRNYTLDSLSASATQMSYIAAAEIDPDMADDFMRRGNLAPGYTKTRERLSILKNSSPDIAFLYVYKIKEDGCHVIFDMDTVLNDGTYVPGDPPGLITDFEEGMLPYLDKLLAGEKIEPVLLEDKYGRFLCSYYPVYDKDGKCVCYAVANVESELVGALLEHFSGRVLLLFAGFLLLIVAISILTTRYNIVMPILSMTAFANDLADSADGTSKESLEKIEELDIHTHDEVEQLYQAFCKLTGDTLEQLNDNKNKTEAIAKMQNVLIITMADMVESRDSDTGAHVAKTAAYVRIILQGLKRNGYYAEKITDKYMRDVEMSAPLHDVGKINIPDAILNKPDKLTDDEYEIMKSHTIAGRKIMENAISSMEGDNYLKEARNMAAYHHERWDGKGYPEGLHGEVIPLSARIMAVADVFDALSSARVYKPAFPFEKAMQIIKDGSGTQFDPKCVEVFIESSAEVRKVLKRYQEIQ